MITFLDLKSGMPEDKTIMFLYIFWLYHYSFDFSHDDKLSQHHMSWYYCIQWVQLRYEVIVRFVVFDGRDDHYCVSFLIIIIYSNNKHLCTLGSVLGCKNCLCQCFSHLIIFAFGHYSVYLIDKICWCWIQFWI